MIVMAGPEDVRRVVNLYGPVAPDYEEIWAPLLRPLRSAAA
jgi:hypothetical protein